MCKPILVFSLSIGQAEQKYDRKGMPDDDDKGGCRKEKFLILLYNKGKLLVKEKPATSNTLTYAQKKGIGHKRTKGTGSGKVLK